MNRLFYLLALCICMTSSLRAQIKNFTDNGKQITRFDQLGNAVDAHDGEIAFFNGTYYLYGTSYDCGFEWNNKTAPFCGFKSYSSKDMVNWKDEGFLFDAQNPLWQSRCDGKTYGCFRPHVVYNKRSSTYVLWINVYDNLSGYRVFVSKAPTGPFLEAPEPKIAVNADMPIAGLNNGDHDLFIDDDGTGYLAFTDWRTQGTIVIEQLTDDYLSGNGKVVRSITAGKTEAPALFKRKDTYYMTYSDPNCGYCSATGTSYKTAKSPLGPWSEGKKISDNSCGGQPSFVSTMKIGSDTIYLYGSDLWNNAAKNEAQANFYWAPLQFASDGSILPLECMKIYALPRARRAKLEEFTAGCDISKGKQRLQLFTATKNGKLIDFEITTLKSGYPDKELIIDFYEVESGKADVDRRLARLMVSANAVSWSARVLKLRPKIDLIKGKQYRVVLSSKSSTGCYGFAVGKQAENSFDLTAISEDDGQSFSVQKNQKLKHSYLIR
ncbi:family 43 glycosylhydrolase [Pedobacter sp. Leaf216]|uniref:family 43 glycosylhydrolase n=1 Tax=Pedobacter sp. Leaf216 TaxID=1735684 RepID=UPI00138F140E|nr:family 43 glycosylhydrolase [Pedobacter sp. Leaf216]